MDLHVTVHNLILQEVKSFENRLPENGGSRRRIRGSQQSDSWLSFIGLMALIHRSGGSKCVGLSNIAVSQHLGLINCVDTYD